MILTKLVRSIHNITPEMRNGVITIGNFDGVHLGHQKLLEKVVAQARKLNAPAIVVTFEPHPFEFFSECVDIPRLSRLREKFHLLQNSGIDYVMVLPFNQSLAHKSASDFVTEVLFEKLSTKRIILGDDFRFGHKRAGNFALLQSMGSNLNFLVEAMPTFTIDDERVSSTRIRELLKVGDLTKAKELLGHPYIMEGRIRRGDQRGRQWGFPTANIFLQRKKTPLTGVYTVLMHGVVDKPLLGVANIGVRPTVDGTRTLLEVHLFNFNQQIYGRNVRVEFCLKLREEKRFANFDLLRAAIANDVTDAKNYFKKLGLLDD